MALDGSVRRQGLRGFLHTLGLGLGSVWRKLGFWVSLHPMPAM